MPYTRADIGRVVGFLPQSSFEQTQLESPSGDYIVCPNCNGSGKHRIDFINRQPKTINGHTFLRGVNVEYCECGTLRRRRRGLGRRQVTRPKPTS